MTLCAYSALTLLVWHQEEHPACKKWVMRCWYDICLERGADCLHMVQLMPLHPKTPSSLASFTSRLVLPFWYQLTQDVPEKRPSSGCSSSKFYDISDITDHWAVIIFTLFYCMFVIGLISCYCNQHCQTLLLCTDEPENFQINVTPVTSSCKLYRASKIASVTWRRASFSWSHNFKVSVSAVFCLDILHLYSTGLSFVWHSMFFVQLWI